MNYIEIDYADAYLVDYKLDPSAWINALTSKRQTAINIASQSIDRLRFKGQKTSPTQTQQFPRDPDTLVPEAIKQATAELAYSLIVGENSEEEIEDQGLINIKYEGWSLTRNPRFVKIAHANGIPSVLAWLLLMPYLADPGDLTLRRV